MRGAGEKVGNAKMPGRLGATQELRQTGELGGQSQVDTRLRLQDVNGSFVQESCHVLPYMYHAIPYRPCHTSAHV